MALPSGVSQEQFYGDADSGNRTDLQGDYQYVALTDIINNFLLMFTGDDNLIPSTISRDKIIFHAKRGLQELTFDVLNEIEAIEIDLNPDTLTLALPEDYVKYVRVSWIDDKGNFHPIITNDDTRIAQAYLQDNAYLYLYDDQGNVLLASQNSYDQTLLEDSISNNVYRGEGYDRFYEDNHTGRFGLQTDKANSNGWVNVDKASGVMYFSSNIDSKTIVLEYISDGTQSDLADIRVHKFAEDALYRYIEWMLLDTRYGIQEFIIKRKRKEYDIARRRAKMRLNALTFDDLMQIMRGKDKRIK